jgi:hypothetical protein
MYHTTHHCIHVKYNNANILLSELMSIFRCICVHCFMLHTKTPCAKRGIVYHSKYNALVMVTAHVIHSKQNCQCILCMSSIALCRVCLALSYAWLHVSEYMDQQTLKLQESPEVVPTGQPQYCSSVVHYLLCNTHNKCCVLCSWLNEESKSTLYSNRSAAVLYSVWRVPTCATAQYASTYTPLPFLYHAAVSYMTCTCLLNVHISCMLRLYLCWYCSSIAQERCRGIYW